VSIDFKFPEHINQGLSALTRSTKEAALLLSGSSFRSMADETPKPPPAPTHSAGLVQASLSSILSPTNISSLTTSNYTPAVPSPSVTAFPITQTGQQQQQLLPGVLNKVDATTVQMKQAGGVSQGGPPGADSTARSPPPPPIVSIPLPRE
jgi:hypothetical protein